MKKRPSHEKDKSSENTIIIIVAMIAIITMFSSAIFFIKETMHGKVILETGLGMEGGLANSQITSTSATLTTQGIVTTTSTTTTNTGPASTTTSQASGTTTTLWLDVGIEGSNLGGSAGNKQGGGIASGAGTGTNAGYPPPITPPADDICPYKCEINQQYTGTCFWTKGYQMMFTGFSSNPTAYDVIDWYWLRYRGCKGKTQIIWV